jgi:hypothetical protein
MVKSVNWECLQVESDRLSLVSEAWQTRLANQGEQDYWIAEAKSQYANWWGIVRTADYEIVRWLCHGHIGLATIWASFGRCVFEACAVLPQQLRKQQAENAVAARAEFRFRAIVEQWTRHALQGHLDCPEVIFHMLGLPGRPVR